MLLQLLCECYWAVEPQAFEQLRAAIHGLNKIEIDAGAADEAERDGMPIRKINNVAIVTLSGTMTKNAPYWSRYLGIGSTVAVARALRAALADDEVEKIIMLVGSPGGSVAGVPELADVVKLVNARKPIVVQVDGQMASAAVWATAGASAIYANRMDMIGSIGARAVVDDSSKMFEADGIRRFVFDTGEHKSAGVPGTEITEAQQKEFQRIVNGYFADFRQTLQLGRNLSDQQVDAVADGRMFFASEALGLGLIDGIQTLEETISQLVGAAPPRTAMTARHRMRALTIDHS